MELIHLAVWMTIILTSTRGGPTNPTNPTNPNSTLLTITTLPIKSNTNDLKSLSTNSFNITSYNRTTIHQTPPLTTATNSSGNGTNERNAIDSIPPSKTWNFLIGIVAAVFITSSLILIAVKIPKWYNYLISYNHHRLQEYQPDMFDQEFNTGMSTGTQPTPAMVDDDDCMVVFEQPNIFVTDDDGFIEDKYIDTQDLTEET